jgi:hypothetical protein
MKRHSRHKVQTSQSVETGLVSWCRCPTCSGNLQECRILTGMRRNSDHCSILSVQGISLKIRGQGHVGNQLVRHRQQHPLAPLWQSQLVRRGPSLITRHLGHWLTEEFWGDHPNLIEVWKESVFWYFCVLVKSPMFKHPCPVWFFFWGWVAEPWAVQHEPGNRDLSIGGEPDLDLFIYWPKQDYTAFIKPGSNGKHISYKWRLQRGVITGGYDLGWQWLGVLRRLGDGESPHDILEVLDVTWFWIVRSVAQLLSMFS